MILGLVTTLSLLSAKLALDMIVLPSEARIPKLMEVIFITNFGFVVISLIHMRIFTKDYLFDFKNRDDALKLA